MKKVIMILTVCLIMFSGCWLSGPEIEADRVGEINDTWLEMYNKDRRATKAEAEEFDKLTDEQKKEWRKAGKPTLLPLSERLLDASKDFHAAVGKEVDAAK